MKSLLACLCWSLLLATAGAADYGKKVTFTKGAPLVFPDCELTFTGTRRVASPVYARGFLYYDFTVSAGGKTRAISWSSGTGDIGPEIFSINGRSFVLELGFAKGIKGPLKENELVLRPE